MPHMKPFVSITHIATAPERVQCWSLVDGALPLQTLLGYWKMDELHSFTECIERRIWGLISDKGGIKPYSVI